MVIMAVKSVKQGHYDMITEENMPIFPNLIKGIPFDLYSPNKLKN